MNQVVNINGHSQQDHQLRTASQVCICISTFNLIHNTNTCTHKTSLLLFIHCHITCVVNVTEKGLSVYVWICMCERDG